jgi:hypothetical protein
MKQFLVLASAAMVVLVGVRVFSNSGSNTYTDENGVTHTHLEFFDLSCVGPTTCTKTANTYVVNVDGLFIEPDREFVDACLEQNNNAVKNRYCTRMYSPGYIENFNTSANLVQHTINNGWNPTDPDVDRRMKAAEKKLYSGS